MMHLQRCFSHNLTGFMTVCQLSQIRFDLCLYNNINKFGYTLTEKATNILRANIQLQKQQWILSYNNSSYSLIHRNWNGDKEINLTNLICDKIFEKTSVTCTFLPHWIYWVSVISVSVLHCYTETGTGQRNASTDQYVFCKI